MELSVRVVLMTFSTTASGGRAAKMRMSGWPTCEEGSPSVIAQAIVDAHSFDAGKRQRGIPIRKKAHAARASKRKPRALARCARANSITGNSHPSSQSFLTCPSCISCISRHSQIQPVASQQFCRTRRSAMTCYLFVGHPRQPTGSLSFAVSSVPTVRFDSSL